MKGSPLGVSTGLWQRLLRMIPSDKYFKLPAPAAVFIFYSFSKRPETLPFETSLKLFNQGESSTIKQ